MVLTPLIKSASKVMLLSRLNFDSNNPRHQALYLQMKVFIVDYSLYVSALTGSRRRLSALSRPN